MKVLMKFIESKTLKRVMVVEMDFAVDERGEIALGYCYSLKLMKVELTSLVAIKSEDDYKLATYFNLSLLKKKKCDIGVTIKVTTGDKVAVRHEQLRNMRTYDSLPIVYCDVKSGQTDHESDSSV